MKKGEEKQFQFHFIPNTHWDREWLYDFQETRMFLVEFLDKLLDIFARFPEYKTYLLDSQTIPIEDYLTIRPDKEKDIIRFVKSKRLFIGPWYTLPEEHLVNGESLVRNLLIGHRLAEKYGGVMKVGYSPFSYGQASQMPQIYGGFGIDTILFYHGIQPWEAPSEFIFEGPDGSRLLASRMGSNARYNFFFSVYRPVVYGKSTDERTYRWEEGGLPFHLASADHYREHHILLDPVKNLFTEKIAASLENLRQAEEKQATTDQIACMQGMDSTQPDELELRTLQESTKILKNGKIFFSSLPEWIKALKASVNWDRLVVLRGERRTPRQLGTRVHLYGDVTSARVRIKQRNALAEQELQRKAEPLAAIASLLGWEYPVVFLDLAWKYLLKGHPHDSIAGTGVDQIEKDMHHRLDQCMNISRGIKKRALQAIQKQIDTSHVDKKEVVLTIFNPSPYSRREVVSAVVDLPLQNGFENYTIFDGTTEEETQFQEISRYEHTAIVRHLGDATMEMPSLRVELALFPEEIPALGYRTLRIRPRKEFCWPAGSLITAEHTMENENLKVMINGDGTLDLTDKNSGHTFRNLHYFADNGEAGHPWRHIPPAKDRVISTTGSCSKIELLRDGVLSASFAVTHKMQIPASLDEGKGDYVRRLDGDGDDAGRSQETREIVIRSELTLNAGSKAVFAKTVLHNTCEDHRLRVMFPTRLAVTHSCAEEPFDVVERVIERGPDNPWKNTWNPTHPMQRFVDVNDGRIGLAILSRGLREYEVTDDPTRTIGITLLRAFEVALATVSWRWERHPEMKGSQVLGEHEFEYVIYPHQGDWDKGQVTQLAERVNGPLEIIQAGPHPGILPMSQGFLEIVPEDLLLSAFKKAADRDSFILRIYNPTPRDIPGKIFLKKEPLELYLVNLNEERISSEKPEWNSSAIHFSAKAKKIITIEMVF